jgi:predicted O-methyltransferase YrrM
MNQASRAEGASRRAAGRSVALPTRLVRDPSLLPVVARKIGSRIAARRHRTRVSLYPQMSVRAAEGLGLVLDRDPALVRAAMGTRSIRRLVHELESHPVPPAAKAMGGAAFLEACFAAVRLLRPEVVVETGVGHGYSTAVILMALEENAKGELTSVDLPVFRPRAAALTGEAIPPVLRASGRWQLIAGPDRRVLPALLPSLPSVDIALYDSDKSYEGMTHSLGLLWAHLRPGGVLIVDDVDANDGFLDFADEVGKVGVVIDKPVGTSLYDRHGARVGLMRKPEEVD